MNNEVTNNDTPDFDDHEPGDVNGNVDPAWAKKQKQKTKQQTQRESRPRPEGARAPRGPRPATARAGARSAAPADSQAAANGDLSAGAVSQAAEAFPPNSAPTPDTASDRTVDVAMSPDEASAQARPSGERRARGMRRPRQTREGSDSSLSSSAANRPESMGSIDVIEGSQLPVENGLEPIRIDSIDSELTFDAGNRSEGSTESGDYINPNPGAFGDPSRPTDTTGRKSRNRFRNREKSERGRAIRHARQAAENAAAMPDMSGTVGVDGVATDGALREGERLHKVLAQQGLGSRRAMEAMIESGEIEVNGEPAKVGQVVNESDRVYVKRRKVTIKLGDDKPRILIYHKPSGEIVSRDDPEARDTVFDRLPRPDHGKWIAIGRLDFNTEGLLLFTTSGELANRMAHPRYEIMREYSVRVLGELEPEQEDQLIDGIELDDGPARVLSLDRIDRDSEGANHWYRITINEGRNREVRRMFEHLGLTVSRLIRTKYGAVNMPSWLKRGQYKVLDENDTFNVLESVGMRSRKKLEKAARFGGARGKLPQGPVGPMRSATEHESIWNGAPAPGVAGLNGRADRRGGRNPQGRAGGMREAGGGSLSLQQQQFPGFGGGAADTLGTGLQRRGRAKGPRGRGGEVNGNIDPNFRAGRGGPNPRRGRGRNPNMSAPPEFDEEGNLIAPTPQLGNDGQPRPPRSPRNARGQGRGQGRANVNADANANSGANGNRNEANGQRNPRGRNRRGRGPRERGSDAAAAGSANENNLGVQGPDGIVSGGPVGAGGVDGARQPRGRGRRNQRRGGRGRGPRDGQAQDGASAPPDTNDRVYTKPSDAVE